MIYYNGNSIADLNANITMCEVDEHYDPTSTNAQSGIAVAEAISASADNGFFGITDVGIIYLKPEYRGLSTTSANMPYSTSDNGVGNAGTLKGKLPRILTIPNEVNGITVTALAEGMFCRNDAIETVVLPDGITSITNYCFWRCENLERVENTINITYVGENAFLRSCIKQILLPNLTSMGAKAFRWAYKLEYIDIGNVSVLPAQCFDECESLNTISGGENITSIPAQCFYDCTELKNVSFLDKLTSIGNYAFKNCAIDYDWQSLADNGCTFGTMATSLQTNPTDFWSGCTVSQTTISPLTATFNQRCERWGDKVISAESLMPTETFSTGCVFFAIMGAYCGLNKRYDFKTAFDLQRECVRLGADQHYTSDLSAIDDFIKALGLQFTKYTSMTTANLQEIYNTISNGGYAIINIPSSATTAKGHTILCYGIDQSTHRLYLADTESREGASKPKKQDGSIYTKHIKDTLQTSGAGSRVFVITIT